MVEMLAAVTRWYIDPGIANPGFRYKGFWAARDHLRMISTSWLPQLYRPCLFRSFKSSTFPKTRVSKARVYESPDYQSATDHWLWYRVRACDTSSKGMRLCPQRSSSRYFRFFSEHHRVSRPSETDSFKTRLCVEVKNYKTKVARRA